MNEQRTTEDARSRREALDEVARRGGPSSVTEAALARYLASEAYHAREAEARERAVAAEAANRRR